MLLALLACNSPPPAADPAPAPKPAAHAKNRKKADTFEVDCTGAAKFTTIMDAVRASDSGDTIEVAPCTYHEDLEFRGRAVRIVGTGGAAVTQIVGTGKGPVVKVDRGEGPGAILEGFTVSGGGSALEPSIEEEFSTLTLRDVVVSGNAGTITVYARSGLLTLERVTFDGTNTASEGMLIQGRRGQVLLKDGSVTCGTVATGYTMEHGAAFIDGTTFSCAGATAALLYHGNGRVQRVVMDGLLDIQNETTSSEPTTVEGAVLEGGVRAYYTVLRLRNTVVKGVTATYTALTVTSSVVTGAACGISSTSGSNTVSYTDFWQNTQDVCGFPNPLGGNGNIAGNPMFVDAAAGDYRLAAGSPLADAGSTTASDDDTDGSRNDIGAYGGPFTLAGGW